MSTNVLSKSLFSSLLLSCFLFPSYVFSATCSENGYTVFFVNDIFNSEEKADEGKADIQNLLGKRMEGQSNEVKAAYNPSHVAGLGDVLEAITQAFGSPVSDFDRNSILMRISTELSTKKVLLVGHSQGTFYTNELYRYLIAHGVAKESIGVYNIATPASYVEGGGGYVTSDNDKIINLIRQSEVDGNVRTFADSYYTVGHVINSALRANISIPPEAGYEANTWGGHKLSVYLDGAAPRIMTDIDASLSRLKASGSTDGACFEPPQEDIAYKTTSLVYSVVDPLAGGGRKVVSSLKGGAASFTDYVAAGINEARHFAQSLLKNFASEGTKSNQIAAAATPEATTADIQQQGTTQTGAALHDTSQSLQTLPAQPTAVSASSSARDANVLVPQSSRDSPTDPIDQEETLSIIATSTQQGMSPGFGGGGEAAFAHRDDSAATVHLAVGAPIDGAALATTSVTFSGTADPHAAIILTTGSTTATTTADGSGNWIMVVILSEGAHSVSVVASNDEGASVQQTRSMTVDVTPPAAPIATVADCTHSLLSTACVVPTTNLTLEWTGDANQYAIYKNGSFLQSVTATSSSVSAVANATTTYQIVAYDLAGNAATSSPASVFALTQPIVLNEIGWGGTDTGTAAGEEWLELKNITDWPIDLGDFSVVRSSGETIALTGITLPAKEKLVIEQSDLSNIGSYELVVPFTDLATGEQLTLKWRDTTIDATPASGTCTGWCAGEFYVTVGSNVSGVSGIVTSLSMERISTTDGTLASSWQTYDSYGARLWGSPGDENSLGLPESGVYCGSPDNLIRPGTVAVPFNPGSSICFYLSRFISGGSLGAQRYAMLFQGTVGSSTPVTGSSFQKDMQGSHLHKPTGGTPAGTEFFYAIYETPPSISGVTTLFGNYFQFGSDPVNGGNPPPHGNYVTIPFTYQP